MGFKLSSSLGSLAGGAIGAYFGGPAGAVAGAQVGNALLGSNDDEMTALEAYQMQRADALADWNRQNEYNSPVNQMKRLQEAGLNPYLVYSGGNVTGNNGSGLSSVSYGGSYAQPTSKRLQNVLQNLNLRAMQADTKGKEVDTEMRELNLALMRAKIAHYANGGMSEYQRQSLDLRRRQYEDQNQYVRGGNLANLNTWIGAWNKLKDWYNSQPKYDVIGEYMR